MLGLLAWDRKLAKRVVVVLTFDDVSNRLAILPLRVPIKREHWGREMVLGIIAK